MSLPLRSWVMSTTSTPSALKPLLDLPILQLLVQVLAVPLPLPQPLLAPTGLLCVGITDPMLRKLRSVVLPAPGRETSCPARGCFLPSFQCSWIFSHLPPGSSLFQKIFGWAGASVSVFLAPPSTSGSGAGLVTADSSSLICSGSRIIPSRFGYHRFDWPFQLAPVALPILGADFLRHHCLLLDVSNQCVCLPSLSWFPWDQPLLFGTTLDLRPPCYPSLYSSVHLRPPLRVSRCFLFWCVQSLKTPASDPTPSADSAWSSSIC